MYTSTIVFDFLGGSTRSFTQHLLAFLDRLVVSPVPRQISSLFLFCLLPVLVIRTRACVSLSRKLHLSQLVVVSVLGGGGENCVEETH